MCLLTGDKGTHLLCPETMAASRSTVLCTARREAPSPYSLLDSIPKGSS